MIKLFISRASLTSLGVVAIATLGVVFVVQRNSDHRRQAEWDRKSKIEQQSSTAAATAIIPALNQYADVVDGNVDLLTADRHELAQRLRKLAALAKDQGTKLDSLNLIYKTSICWNELGGHLTTDADIMETTLPKMGPYLRTSSAQFNRKIAAVLQKHANQDFENSAYLASDLDQTGYYFREYVVSHDSSYAAPASGSHTDFIKETSDLPSSAQYALDKIYKANPARAWELSQQAHEAGVQNLPNR